jgi:hypothetical protein
MPVLSTYRFDDKYSEDTDGFTFDLAAWLGVTGDTISTATATVTPEDAQVVEVVQNQTAVSVWISGGSPGVTYYIDLHVRTSGIGAQMSRDCRIRGSFGVIA